MSLEKLLEVLYKTWGKTQAADEAKDAIWGEPFDGYTVPIKDLDILKAANKDLEDSLVEAWKLVNAMAGQDYWERAEEWLKENERFCPEEIKSVKKYLDISG
jgi:hypothetical protein